MILYENTKENFDLAMRNRSLISFITDEYNARTSRKVSPVDKGIWKYTLEVLKQLLDSANISADCGLRIDYVMLDTNNRFEVIIAGENDDDKIVHIIEMLPWEKVKDTNELDLVSYDSSEKKDIVCVHPSYQSVSYKKFFSKSQEVISVSSCVYLFECKKESDSIQLVDRYKSLTQEAPIYFAEDSDLLSNELSVFKNSKNGIHILNFFHERDQLSTNGIDAFLTGIINDEELAILTEEQRLVAASIIKRCDDTTPSLVVIKGAPGTGKTMLEISCMAELGKRKKKVAYLSMLEVQCEMLQEKLRDITDYDFDIEVIPKFIGKQHISFQKYDVIFVDEAQRIVSSANNQPFFSRALNTIIKSGVMVVFVVSELQFLYGKVTTADELLKYAEDNKKTGVIYNLNQNVRYSGRGSGINWLAHQFQIADTGNFEDWDSDSYEIGIVDNPHELLQHIKEKNGENDPSRVLVRYRKRSELEYDNTTNELYYTIPSYDFRIPVCTIQKGKARDWYKNDSFIDHTAGPAVVQGLEFYYVGVIIGKELGYDKENGKVIIKCSCDNPIDEIDELQFIKMAYYILLSRGIKGVFLFIEDPSLKDYIAERLNYACRRFSWIKELAEKYKSSYEELVINKQEYKSSFSYATHIYEAINEFVLKLKQFSEDQLDSDTYKKISDQCSDLLLKLQDEPLNQFEIQEKYQKTIISNMGESAWDKLSEIGKKCLISAELTYHDMKDYNQLYDFSSVCIQASKAVEYELTKRFFIEYVAYLENLYDRSNYPDEFIDKLPCAIKKQNKNNSERLLREQEVTLGTIPYIVGIDMQGTINNQEAYDSFKLYASSVLIKNNLSIINTLTNHIKYITRIKNDYRNKAAHKNPMDVVSAKACLDYIIEVQRVLGQMLDDYNE